MRRAPLAGLVLALGMAFAAVPALAHRLNVFAWIDGDTVVVEGKFSNGTRPQVGTVEVYDGLDELVLTLPIGADGTARFPLDMSTAAGGLRIQLSTDAGHEDYWILTPRDIEAQRESAGS